MATRSNRIEELAAATPASRDRYVDLLRAVSIMVVVFGHWLMAIVYLHHGRLDGMNALDAVPGLWLATWVLQVMPLFFFVGGFSNRVGWKSTLARGGTYGEFLRSRTERLLRPTLIFIGSWSVVAGVAHVAAPASFDSLAQATELLAKPLWFLAVYVLVVALAPAMLSLHERHGARVLAVMAGAAVFVDVVRIGLGLTSVGYLNFACVWLFAHQLGYFYGDGTLTALSRRALAASAIGALALLAILTGSGIYSPSMVGMATERASNNSPPTICLIVLTVWLTSVALLLRPRASRWLQRRKPWMAVIAANSMIMTIFLWHLTALLIAVLALYPLGWPQPVGGSAVWWAWRPVWMAILSLILCVLVAAFARFERPGPLRAAVPGGPRTTAAVVGGVAGLVLGLSGFATAGFAIRPVELSAGALLAQPLVNGGLVAAGYRMLGGGKAGRE